MLIIWGYAELFGMRIMVILIAVLVVMIVVLNANRKLINKCNEEKQAILNQNYEVFAGTSNQVASNLDVLSQKQDNIYKEVELLEAKLV